MDGTSRTWSAIAPICVSPSVAIAITSAPRARTSWMLESIFGYTWHSVAIATTGTPSSTSAMGPCFSSAAGNPSAWM